MKSPVRFLRTYLAVVFVLLAAAFAVQAQDEYTPTKEWESYDYTGRTMMPAEINSLTIDDLKLIRGIVFGKHGRVFKDPDIRRFLESRPWYKADANFSNSALNNTERLNLDVVRIAEAEQHETVQPGDMRLWEDRALTRKKLGAHTNAEWTVLASEIEAIHGRRFDDTPWLQQYFAERYAYSAAANYNPKSLNDTERKNLALIDLIRKQQRKV